MMSKRIGNFGFECPYCKCSSNIRPDDFKETELRCIDCKNTFYIPDFHPEKVEIEEKLTEAAEKLHEAYKILDAYKIRRDIKLLIKGIEKEIEFISNLK